MTAISLVDYLVLDDAGPHLEANGCTSCGALFFDHRNACGHCGRREFSKIALANEGIVRSFTIVYRAAPGVPAPFASAVVDLDGGGTVEANIVGVEPNPESIHLGMPVSLTTFIAGVDDEGTEAIRFGFKPR